MTNKILFCNIGWMDKYEGITDTDQIIGGGKYVTVNNRGGEVYNFLIRNGYCYGYVQPVNRSNIVTSGIINIKRLGAHRESKSINGVDVVITATRPKEGGTFVIGWYKNATIYKEKQYFLETQVPFELDTQGNQYGYRFFAQSTDVHLLLPDQRTLRVPRATGLVAIEGGMGQSNVWYADKLVDNHFIESVKNLIADHKSSNTTKSTSKPDNEKKKLVETVAVNVVTEHFQNYGYSVKSVESDNLGWDLEAEIDNLSLKIEVKGLSGNNINVGLTPNEYRAFTSKHYQHVYRLCIVTNCLSHNPILHTFSYNIPSGNWLNDEGEQLQIFEHRAATISLIT